MKTYTMEQIYRAAESLFEPEDERGHPEYARGVCELIGRLRLDFGGEGDGTHENALEAARRLDISPRWIKS